MVCKKNFEKYVSDFYIAPFFGVFSAWNAVKGYCYICRLLVQKNEVGKVSCGVKNVMLLMVQGKNL